MALKRLTIDGYGQIETNNFAAPRDGRIEAQCGLDATDFADIPAENGMLLAVDNVTRKVKLPEANGDLPIALNYSTEHMYDERLEGLKNFKITLEENGDYFFPRLGYLSIGDKFTANCIAYDSEEDTTWTTDEAFKEAMGKLADKAAYGCPCGLGAVKVTGTKPTEGVVLKVIKKTTMPDGQFALKFQVINA